METTYQITITLMDNKNSITCLQDGKPLSINDEEKLSKGILNQVEWLTDPVEEEVGVFG